MTRQRYSKKEAWNRILRSWQGTAIPSDVPDSISGEILSEDEALSDLAELLEGSLPNEDAVIPSAARATTAEAQAGTEDTKAVTSAGVAAAIAVLSGASVEYGAIYNNSTGTAVVSLSTSWAKVTGSFQGNTTSSDNVTPDFNDDRIIVGHNGVLFVGVQASFSGDASVTYEGAVYVDSVRQESIRFRRKLGAGGDVGSASATGIIVVTGSPVDVEFYARTDTGTPDFKMEAGQLWLYGLPEN